MILWLLTLTLASAHTHVITTISSSYHGITITRPISYLDTTGKETLV